MKATTMTSEELEEWARKELPTYRPKNVYPEYIKESKRNVEDVKTNWLIMPMLNL
jgi:hypothetical protein